VRGKRLAQHELRGLVVQRSFIRIRLVASLLPRNAFGVVVVS
jgi:hypothetical protein